MLVSQHSSIKMTASSHFDIDLIYDQQDKKNLNWDNFPVYISPEEIRYIDLSVVANFLTSGQSPSERAGFKATELCSVAKSIDREFIESWKKYKGDLNEASHNDLMNLDQIESVTTVSVIIEGLTFIQASSTFLYSNLALFLPKTFGAYSAKAGEIEDHKKKGSAGRVMWLHQVSLLEVIRLEKVKTLLERKCKILIKDCEKFESEGILATNKIKKLDQLTKIFKVHFPSEQFIVTGKNKTEDVEEFVRNRRDALQN